MNELEFAEAMRELTAKNYERARSLLQALNEDNEAQLQLAYLLDQGLGGARDVEKAREVYQMLADNGDVRGMYYLASLLLDQRHLPQALEFFEKSAELGHISGAYWAAALHDGAFGHPKDNQKYLHFNNKAVALGHVFAKRDQARQQMKEARNLYVWSKSFLRYAGAKTKGIGIAIRNSQDLRLR
jgi:TPR repeat protein